MIRRILLELLLFSIPFVVFYAYRAASRDMSVRDRWPLTTLVVIGGVLAIGGLVIGPLMQPSDEGKCYTSARYIDGVRIEPQLVPCDEVNIPVEPPDTTPESPVAPRDVERER